MADPESGRSEESEMALVLTTVPTREAGEELVRRLVEDKLVACGNLLPGLLSLFWWQGAVSREDEVLILLKASTRGVPRLFERVGELHPYEVPELVELPVGRVGQAYCRWVIDSTEGRS
jgi:periplasmic divalent cation tolerance protein